MSDFVAACRREWSKLGVPDSVADDMAAEISADLADAASDGVSAEELLGDPTSFAAAWAAERGVIGLRDDPHRFEWRRGLVPVVLLLAVAAVAAGVAILATRPGSSSVSPLAVGRGPGAQVWTATPARPRSLVLTPVQTMFFAPSHGSNASTVAWIFIAVGGAGVVLTAVSWRVRRMPARA
ncbi:MAG TPA: hypothetical protein VLJ76_09985 [Gaiellaceae bacterium]|nr:hypothetical protein [Gaiellaceae bacterium]